MNEIDAMPEAKSITQTNGELSRLTGAQLQARFAEREASLKRHVEALTSELKETLGNGEKAISENPTRVVAAVAIGAVALGLLVGWKKRSADREEDGGLSGLLDGYSHAFADEVTQWVDKGKTVGEAVSHALKGARPVVYFEPPPEPSRSKVKQTAGSLAKTALGYALKAALAEFSSSLVRRGK